MNSFAVALITLLAILATIQSLAQTQCPCIYQAFEGCLVASPTEGRCGIIDCGGYVCVDPGSADRTCIVIDSFGFKTDQPISGQDQVACAFQAVQVVIPSGLDPDQQVDYIVVGGGNSGIPVAVNLAAAGNKVLLLERGLGSERSQQSSLSTLALRTVEHTWTNQDLARDIMSLTNDWQVEGAPGWGKSHPVPTGHSLGGITNINSGIYEPPSVEDVDAWGIPEWSGAELNAIGTAIRDSVFLGGEQAYNQTNVFDVIQSAASFGVNMRIPRTTSRQGIRLTAMTYFQAFPAAMQNLLIVPFATVDKIETETDEQGQVRATGVRYSVDRVIKLARASKEVILAAGAINTPTILLRSGIGPAQDLQDAKIPVVVENEAVGSGLQSRPQVVHLLDSTVVAPENSLAELLQLQNYFAFLAQGGQTGSIYAATIEGAYGTYTDPGSGKRLYYFYNTVLPRLTGSALPESARMANCMVLDSDVEGYVKLNLDNPQDPMSVPRVLQNFLAPTDPNGSNGGYRSPDTAALVSCLSRSRLIFQSTSFATQEIAPSASVNTSEALAWYVVNALRDGWHHFGTCKINTCVDRNLKVLGVQNLRVADVSVIPGKIGMSPMGYAYTIATKAAQLILQENAQN